MLISLEFDLYSQRTPVNNDYTHILSSPPHFLPVLDHWLQFLVLLFISVALNKAMAPHSSTPAWKIPRTEEPGGPQPMGSQRVGHDWATSLSLFSFMHRRRKWQPTPVFLPGESQGRGSLVGCRLWGRTQSRTQLKRLSSSSSKQHLISLSLVPSPCHSISKLSV